MSLMTSSTNSFWLDEVVSIMSYDGFLEEEKFVPVLYQMRMSDKRRERSASNAALREFAVKPETEQVALDTFTQQFEKDFTQATYGKRVAISWELVKYQDWSSLQDIAVGIGDAAAYTMEKKGAALFVDAFNGATFKAEDGLSICNAAHVNVDSGNSQSNTDATSLALSVESLITVRERQRDLTNYKGDIAGVRPDLLLCGADQEYAGWSIVRSAERPDTADRSSNMFNGLYNLVVWDHLTTTGEWFSIDSKLMKKNLMFIISHSLEMFGDGNLSTGTKTVGGIMAFTLGCKDWRWIYGCT